MLALVQRVARAQVRVGGEAVGTIARGLLVFVCAEPDDGAGQVERLVDKLLKLRVFADEAGKMNLDLRQVQGALLVVSQFTLAAETKGNRPGFSAAAPPALGRELYLAVLERARAQHPFVEAGEFGADMQVELVNDGPVTIPLTVR